VIIGRFVSLPGLRLAATLVALWLVTLAAVGVFADALAPSTWVALKLLPRQGHSAIFGLAVDPVNSQLLIAGNSEGSLLRSTNGGSTWASVHSGKSVSTTIVFDPYQAGLVLAGTRGSGAVFSRDDGATWLPVSGLDGRVVHAFSFATTLVAAATDKGVFLSQDGSSWSPSGGLANRSIDTVAVTAVHTPIRMVAASDGPLAAGTLPMFQTSDGGTTWSAVSPAISGTFVVKLAAGPLPPVGDIRPLVAGTNAGLFQSIDNGASFLPLSGGNQLPSTDYTQVAFITNHFDRFYAASDGGGSGAGGLWRTNDAGQTFISLAPPMPSITALAVSNDESPTLYVATFRPSDHAAALWVYRDTGGTPQGPLGSSTPVASGTRGGSGSSGGFGLPSFLTSSQAPYIALGLGALLIVLLAGVAHLRGRRRR
jgi:photosystem II stability/assembly factor-like uncharacterized protein